MIDDDDVRARGALPRAEEEVGAGLKIWTADRVAGFVRAHLRPYRFLVLRDGQLRAVAGRRRGQPRQDLGQQTHLVRALVRFVLKLLEAMAAKIVAASL